MVYKHKNSFLRKLFLLRLFEWVLPGVLLLIVVYFRIHTQQVMLDICIAILLIGAFAGFFQTKIYPSVIKMEDLKFCLETGRNRKEYDYEQVKDIQYYQHEVKLWEVIPVHRSWGLMVNVGGDKYYFDKTYLSDFEHLKADMELRCRNVILSRCEGLQREQISLEMGKGLQVKKGRLMYGQSAYLSLEDSIMEREDRGWYAVYYKKGETQQLWMKLNPEKYCGIFQLKCVLQMFFEA